MSDLRWLDDAEDPARIALRRGLDEGERFTHSELMQRRVWARVSDPARTFRATRRAFVRGALVASAVTAMAVVALERTHVAGASGAEVASATTSSTDAAVNASVSPSSSSSLAVVAPAGADVETQEGERLIRLLPRGARAELAPGTLMGVDVQGRPEVRHGEVRFSVAANKKPSAAAQVFSVRIASYRVVVAGARFVVKAEAQSITIAVEDGEAEIWNGSRMVRIGSGETWSSASEHDARDDHEAHAVSRPGAPRSAHDHTPALAPAPSTLALAEQDEQDTQDLAAARAARAASDPRRALALYEHLASRSGPAAENALYEIGGIYHDQLKQPAKAVAAWERYRTRYPNGLLRAEADLSVIDTLAMSSATDGGDASGTRTLGEALAFLKRYPHSERRGEVARVVGDIYRGRSNCHAALDFYRVVGNAKASPEDADDSSFGQAACLYSLRDDGADAALRSYVAQNPRGRHARDAARLLGDKATP
jgi:FecR protein/Tetratricopeptide repeat